MVLMPFFLFVKKSPAWWIPLCGGAYQQGCKYPSALAAILRVRMLMPDSPGGTRHHADDGTLRIQKLALLRKGFFMGKYHELYIGYFYYLSILVTRYRAVQYLNLYVMCWIHNIASRRPFYFLTLASLLTAIWFIQQSFFRVISIIRGIRSWGCFLYGYAAAPVRCCCTWCEIHKGVSRCESRMLCMWRTRRKWAYRG